MQPNQKIRTVPSLLAAATAVFLLTTGCATHKFVRTQDAAHRAELGEQIAGIGTSVEEVQGDVERLEGTVEEQGRELEGVSGTAREALERAMAAGKLAEGKFVYETVLSDDSVRFGLEQATLSDEASAELDAFARRLKEEDADVYVEIQGHTDASGEEEYNLVLGERRSEAVRRYLSLEHDVPLHRMGVISYGESAPAADNSTREGRSANRRVALVVLK